MSIYCVNAVAQSCCMAKSHEKTWNLKLGTYYEIIWNQVDTIQMVILQEKGWDWEQSKFKARLMAKGYLQVFGMDFSRYSPPPLIIKLKSIRLLLATAAEINLEIHQMNRHLMTITLTAYLNGIPEEYIYGPVRRVHWKGKRIPCLPPEEKYLWSPTMRTCVQ